MTPNSPSPSMIPRPVGLPPAPSGPARPSRLLSSIYHDIGMAAVAVGLDLPADSHDSDAHEAVKRGNRYIYLMPKRQDAPAPPPA